MGTDRRRTPQRVGGERRGVGGHGDGKVVHNGDACCWMLEAWINEVVTPHAGHLHSSQSGGGGARFGANESKSGGSKQVDSVPVNLNAAATPR